MLASLTREVNKRPAGRHRRAAPLCRHLESGAPQRGSGRARPEESPLEPSARRRRGPPPHRSAPGRKLPPVPSELSFKLPEESCRLPTQPPMGGSVRFVSFRRPGSLAACASSPAAALRGVASRPPRALLSYTSSPRVRPCILAVACFLLAFADTLLSFPVPLLLLLSLRPSLAFFLAPLPFLSFPCASPSALARLLP